LNNLIELNCHAKSNQINGSTPKLANYLSIFIN